RVARRTDADERVHDTPHRAEQTDERSDGADRCEEGHARLQAKVHTLEFDADLVRHAVGAADAGAETGLCAVGLLDGAFGYVAEGVATSEDVEAFIQRVGVPERRD